MADRVVPAEPNEPHVPLNAVFFERLVHHDDGPPADEGDAPWYVRFAHAWASWCGRHDGEGEHH